MRNRHRTENLDLVDQIIDLQRRIKNLESAARIGNTSVDSGKIVLNNGALVVKHANGTELFRTGHDGIGATTFDDVYVTRVRRPDNSEAFVIYSTDNHPGAVVIYDQQGNTIFSEDFNSGRGLGRPYLAHTFVPTANLITPSQTTNAIDFTPLWSLSGEMQHSNIRVSVLVQVPGGTTGEVRLVSTASSNVISPAQTVADGEYDYKILEGEFDVDFGAQFQYDVEARVTSGPGDIGVEVVYSVGCFS